MKNLKFPDHKKDALFFKDLSTEVNRYFQGHNASKKGNNALYIKAAFLFVTYALLYLTSLLLDSYLLYLLIQILLGISTISLALNVGHDAAHGTFSKNKKWNAILLYTFDLLGANGYLWKLKHVHSHHPHVNIPNMDGDIKQSKLVRIFPEDEFKRFHKYQYIYMPFLYLCYTLVWLLFRDFRDFAKADVSGKPNLKHPPIEIWKLILGKLFYISRVLLIPYLVLPFSFAEILLGFILLNFAASATVALALISAHVGEHSVYPEPNKNGMMPHSYIRHQIVTTVDFSTSNVFLTQLFGGFNHHVVHHLFPNICHIHYPALTKILEDTCISHGMPYQSNPRLTDAIKSHFRFLYKRSQELKAVEYLEI